MSYNIYSKPQLFPFTRFKHAQALTQKLTERNKFSYFFFQLLKFNIARYKTFHTHITHMLASYKKKHECGSIRARDEHEFVFYDYYLILFYCCDVMAGFCSLISFNLFVELIEFHLEFDTVDAHSAQHTKYQHSFNCLFASLLAHSNQTKPRSR